MHSTVLLRIAKVTFMLVGGAVIANIHSWWILPGSQLPKCTKIWYFLCMLGICMCVHPTFCTSNSLFTTIQVELSFMLVASWYWRVIGPAFVGMYWGNSVRSALNERCSSRVKLLSGTTYTCVFFPIPLSAGAGHFCWIRIKCVLWVYVPTRSLFFQSMLSATCVFGMPFLIFEGIFECCFFDHTAHLSSMKTVSVYDNPYPRLWSVLSTVGLLEPVFACT